jgi:hypothetical protein
LRLIGDSAPAIGVGRTPNWIRARGCQNDPDPNRGSKPPPSGRGA